MTGAPTISIVIPVRDDAAKLENCLEALWLQTRLARIIVVDNDSSDLTRTVVGWWPATYVFEARHGIAAAAAAGYDAATGDIIARLDADSVPPPDWIQRVREAFADDPGLAALTGPGDFGSLPRPLTWMADVFYMQAYFVICGRLVGHPPVFGSNFALTREAWEAAREHMHRDDREVHDDLDLSYCLPQEARVRLDQSLRVQISARPFADPVAFARRIRRAVHTVQVNRGSPTVA
jgi:cellulose synthase/poly-beta-1,6-N-acetylglucosamine synthase-like glycosyltransferase